MTYFYPVFQQQGFKPVSRPSVQAPSASYGLLPSAQDEVHFGMQQAFPIRQKTGTVGGNGKPPHKPDHYDKPLPTVQTDIPPLSDDESETSGLREETQGTFPSTETASKKKGTSGNSNSFKTVSSRASRKRLALGIRLRAPRDSNSAFAKRRRERQAKGIRLHAPRDSNSAIAKSKRAARENIAQEALKNFDISGLPGETVSNNTVTFLKNEGIIDKKLSTLAVVTVLQKKLEEAMNPWDKTDDSNVAGSSSGQQDTAVEIHRGIPGQDGCFYTGYKMSDGTWRYAPYYPKPYQGPH